MNSVLKFYKAAGAALCEGTLWRCQMEMIGVGVVITPNDGLTVSGRSCIMDV